MHEIAVITGAGAGVGRATALEFARNGFDVALLSRDPDRLEAVAELVRAMGRRVLPIPTDVANAEEVEAAASRVEGELGPIRTWVNVAMATVFAPVSELTPEEVLRATQVTYLGQVHGMMAALKRMRIRNRGTIVNVGSALAYRSVPLQAAYCGAKAAIRGFTNSLRSEIIHDGLDIQVTMVHLPAVNTPQFDWALNKTGKKAQPVPPIFEPEVAARAIHFGATHDRREVWVGYSTVQAIVGNASCPGCSTAIWRRRAIVGSSRTRPCRRTRRRTCSIRSPDTRRRTAASTTGRSARAGKCSPVDTVTRSSPVSPSPGCSP